MLSGSNDRVLAYKNINPEFVFFYQRWQELLESRTLDMYQYNILNSCVACIELIDVINKTLDGLLTSRQNVDDTKAESLEILKHDDILTKYNRPLRNALLRIVSTKIESKQKSEVNDDRNSSFFTSLNRLKYQLLTPIRLLRENYLSYVLQELKIAIDTQNESQIEKHMSSLVSQCINDGWSAKGLFIQSECFEGVLPLNDKWRNFTDKVSLHDRDSFEVYYSIKIETRQGISAADVRRIISDLGMVIKKGNEIIDDNANRQDLYSKLDSEKYYLVVPLAATDIYSATLSAINQLNQRLSVATFYNTISPWIANSPQIVVHCLNKNFADSLKITDVFRTYDYVDSTNNVFEDTKNILINTQKAQIMNRLHSAFSYTNLSRSSIFQETKYISLWIALESVMRTGQYSDIISHIKCVLPEILSIRYLYRILRNFSEDCIRCGFKTDITLDINMEVTNKKQLVSKLITIFRAPAQYAVLEHCCEQNKLLVYRCKEIRALVNDTSSIISKFEHYSTKIRWHIQRLYRIRNEITHSAFQEDKSLTIYIEHLYTYLAQLISEVVFYIEHKNAGSVEEAFSTILENYNTFMEIIKEGHIVNHDVLPDGIIDIIN